MIRRMNPGGYIVLPRPYRRLLGLVDGLGEYFEITLQNDALVLRVVAPKCACCGAADQLIRKGNQLLCISCKAALTTKDKERVR